MSATFPSFADISSKFSESTLDEIIKNAGGTRHTSYKFGPSGKKGDAYLSRVFRITIYGVKEGAADQKTEQLEVSVIVKAMPDNLHRRRLFRSVIFFRNEIHFYTKVIPAIEAFQKSRKPAPQKPFVEFPKCLAYVCDGVNDFIALEDVGPRGYKAPARQDYISLDDALLTMRTLGRFHGVALAFNSLDPENFEKAAASLEETYYGEHTREWYTGFLLLAENVAKDAIKQIYPNSKYETVAGNFLQPNLFDDLVSLVSTRSKLSVFGHGDCWTPNFLTKYGEQGESQEIIIIDFQLARCSSLALDLSFFVYSCTSQELRERHYDELLRAYLESAQALIRDLGGDAEAVISWESLQEELKNFGRFGCGMGIESLPMTMIEDDEVADLDGIQENAILTDVWNITPFKEPAKQQRLADIFKHAIDQGYIR
ncbi:uncharacterized protein Dana_GF19128 [Drosophila ananassae]|uniref:CHK kinase-like domain-containing protein n=1 Tax=Drosophila ananassae TaxID=7217 RepID=B3MZG8_DROAN|nr:uncharacterized protein LOC6501890 [Drosophila ananassae]XP_032308110.1 uncharacterized protein LOC6501890 [Drosophila ananassae]EDV33769.1 uncharacterized protein Dana_GF19128 [Drosophila ananassae]